ncbi:hypothetical protein CLV30_12269 [Haloactinopolyspora alba]|uniref:Glycosyltransferase A (GT-A) superfamily protein (DUF2064 family) n=1 Tax=Haloactinopolyspora alba TaxID=648780 RepID=A0A2P8DK30_9ACTN|nr:DUF2064 domain-containing protein [Haloactinopolyspora alba]PSK97577.1 hypothetical protein CLV30_12269 [Haloactinopolyspora alba]
MNGSHVLVVAKAPEPGRSKTRLCPPCTPADAARIAEASLADTLEAVAGCGAERRILALDGPPGPWLPPGFEVVPQVSGPFGQRLAAAWEHAGGPGFQIGMDTPQLTPGLLDDVLAQVTEDDALLGPADDGGWWGLGLRRWRPGVFDGVAMSTAHTGFDQYTRLTELGLTVRMLPTVRDLDTAPDAEGIAMLAPASRTAHAVRSALWSTPA